MPLRRRMGRAASRREGHSPARLYTGRGKTSLIKTGSAKEMGINGVGMNGIRPAGYPMTGAAAANAQKKTEENGFAKALNNAAAVSGKEYIVYMPTEDTLYSGGNGTGLSYYIQYAQNSTEEDPTVIAKGVDENGEEFEQTIHLNKINPRCATVVEMHALEAHLGVDKNGGLTSLPPETGRMGLHDTADFMELFQKQINDMKLLKQSGLAAYYQYSMRMFEAFMDREK